MPTFTAQPIVSNAILSLRSAENLITQQIRSADDPLQAIKLTQEYSNLDSILSQLLHAQNAADDASFCAIVATLKTDAGVLQTDEATIKELIKDVETAAQVIGYITQALNFISKL